MKLNYLLWLVFQQAKLDGKLIEKPSGKMYGWHAAIVEGYDFNENCLFCKNSWGGTTAEPRFNLKPSATHKCHFTHVYFTLKSIKGKTNKTFHFI